MADIEIQGLDELYAKLERVAANAALRPPMVRAVERIRRRVADYPPPPREGHWAANTTPRQKRAFFALLRAGRISGTRTGKLGQSWTTRVSILGEGVTGVVGTNRPYARYVQDDQRQARFHQGRWSTAQDAIARERGGIEADFAIAVRRALGR